jgi:hypothetical protein
MGADPTNIAPMTTLTWFEEVVLLGWLRVVRVLVGGS